ncbi:zinc-ribbon and DUF3426 domain-containing protein [Hydrogenophaga pseudoflava]|uniref:zinc-ribbon and DUF3426 domain-containing protein n=1 Tax=Hydrogenophaga pseudoflava TaxID=47421 RepID=UPI0027E3FCFA|nr:zinc-ribbon and DUF3426 domain-containing protein [Hydrogenophaga pseudoflava]MDQ7744984.1 zinc-ribbon and DUF3426 domain-containing protein [Hydrogenophaga pseudoflava]
MSFTTRCPACGTTFRIVPDQLKISDGWVRCGHCSDVFDATLFLEKEPVAVAAAAVSTVSVPPAPAAQDDGEGEWLLHPGPAPATPPLAPGPALTEEGFADELRRFAAEGRDGIEVADVPVEILEPEPLPAGAAPAADVSRPPAPRQEPPLQPKAPPPPLAAPASVQDEDDVPVLAEPSFVRQARRKAFWQSRGVRISLVAVTFMLLAGLVAQWSVHERDRLAARHPFTAPWLTALCQPLGCSLGAARQIEAVSIDSSNLVRRLGNFYSFDLVLKNSAALPLAVPALELSLTDTRDNVIARRVFLPAELPGAPEVLPAQGAVSMSLRLSIADSGVSSMTGYRALVFYP